MRVFQGNLHHKRQMYKRNSKKIPSLLWDIQAHITLPSFHIVNIQKFCCNRRRSYFYCFLWLLLLPSTSSTICHWSVLVPSAPKSLFCATYFRSFQTSTVLGLYCTSRLVLLLFGYYSECCFLFCFCVNLFLPTNGMFSSFITYSLIY